MNKTLFILAAAGVAVASVSAFAQEASAPKPLTETIVVTAPYVVQEKAAVDRAKAGSPHAPVLAVTMERNVSYSDLDLSKTADAAIFKKRINDAAIGVCKELDTRYPTSIYIPVTGAENCVKAAARDGLDTAGLIISVYQR